MIDSTQNETKQPFENFGAKLDKLAATAKAKLEASISEEFSGEVAINMQSLSETVLELREFVRGYDNKAVSLRALEVNLEQLLAAYNSSCELLKSFPKDKEVLLRLDLLWSEASAKFGDEKWRYEETSAWLRKKIYDANPSETPQYDIERVKNKLNLGKVPRVGKLSDVMDAAVETETGVRPISASVHDVKKAVLLYPRKPVVISYMLFDAAEIIAKHNPAAKSELYNALIGYHIHVEQPERSKAFETIAGLVKNLEGKVPDDEDVILQKLRNPDTSIDDASKQDIVSHKGNGAVKN